MKWALFCLVAMLCSMSFAQADEATRSLQQTLKNQGFHYGDVTGDKNAETTAAIRRYQIRNGLQVTGQLNEETLRSVKSTSNSVAAATRPTPNPTAAQLHGTRLNGNARLSQSSPPSVGQQDHSLQTNPSYSASFYQSAPIRLNSRLIAGAQYQLMSRGYYRGRVDGKYGGETAFALRAFQSSAGLPATGRFDPETLQALGSSNDDGAYSMRATPGYETWMPVRKFKDGRWKLKWKRYHPAFSGDDGDQDQQANSQSGWYSHSDDY